jgi:hypothetical protein
MIDTIAGCYWTSSSTDGHIGGSRNAFERNHEEAKIMRELSSPSGLNDHELAVFHEFGRLAPSGSCLSAVSRTSAVLLRRRQRS